MKPLHILEKEVNQHLKKTTSVPKRKKVQNEESQLLREKFSYLKEIFSK